MIEFTLTTAGVTAYNNASAASPLQIDDVVLYNGNNAIGTGTLSGNFTGNVVRDESGIQDYLVIDFESLNTTNSSVTVTGIKLKSNAIASDGILAESESLSIVIPGNKRIKMRITARMIKVTDSSTVPPTTETVATEKFSFATITIGLPYATKFRQGVIRLANLPNEPHPECTVFTATDTEAKIQEYIHSADQYVPWDVNPSTSQPDTGSLTVDHLSINDVYGSSATHTATLTVDSNGDLVTDTYITGTAVVNNPTVSNGEISNTPTKAITTVNYIKELYSNSVDTAQTETYGHKLVTSHAVRDYVTTKLDSEPNNYVHKSGNETIAGNKTFSNNVIVNGTISGNAIQSLYSDTSQSPAIAWDNSANYSKLPTVEVVHLALNDVSTAYAAADNNLQSQIDALNAGQNLADIVATTAALQSHSTDNLQPGNGTTVVGDKVQVLHDSDGNSVVYELRTGAASAATDLPAQAKPNPDGTSTTCHWAYIGEYGNDAYSKSDADATFVKIADLDDALTTPDGDTAPSTLGVTTYVTTLLNDYVKLQSGTTQAIVSPLTITGATEINGIGINTTSSVYTVQSKQASADNFQVKSTATTAEFNLLNSSSNVLWGIVLDDTKATISGVQEPDKFVIKRGGAAVVDIKPIITNSTVTGYNVTGDAIADYTDITPTAPSGPTDGRLVTVDYMKSYTGSMSAYAQLAAANTFTNDNTFNGDVEVNGLISGSAVYDTYTDASWNTSSSPAASTDTAPKIPTVSAVNDAIEASKLNMSTVDAVGSMGLFIYTEYDGTGTSGAEKGYGDTVSGAYLKPVGMSLPMSGQISYKAVNLLQPLSGTWKLLSIAMRRTLTEPCLVLAQKISD